LFVESASSARGSGQQVSKSPTIDDFSSLATLKADLEPISEEELKAK